jgi:hypothetical protein
MKETLRITHIENLANEYFAEKELDKTKLHSQWRYVLNSFCYNLSIDKMSENISYDNFITILEDCIDLTERIQRVTNFNYQHQRTIDEEIISYFHPICSEIKLSILNNAIIPPEDYDQLLRKKEEKIPKRESIDDLVQDYLENSYIQNSLLDFTLLRLSLLSEIFWFIYESNYKCGTKKRSKFLKAILDTLGTLFDCGIYLGISAVVSYVISPITMGNALLALLACRIIIELSQINKRSTGGQYVDIIRSMREVWNKTAYTTSAFSAFEIALLKSDSAICWPSNIYALIEARKDKANGLIVIPNNVILDYYRL